MRSEVHEAAVMDWVHFNQKEDKPHSIEPGAQVLLHTLSPKHVHTATALLERIVAGVGDDTERKSSMATALRILLKKGMVRSVKPVLEAEAVSAELRDAFHTIIKPALPAALNDVLDRKKKSPEDTQGDNQAWSTNVAAAIGNGPVELFTERPDDAGAIQGLLRAYLEHQSTLPAPDEALVTELASLLGSLCSKPTATDVSLVPLLSALIPMAHSESEFGPTSMAHALAILDGLQATTRPPAYKPVTTPGATGHQWMA